jgi:hypothetical protein
MNPDFVPTLRTEVSGNHTADDGRDARSLITLEHSDTCRCTFSSADGPAADAHHWIRWPTVTNAAGLETSETSDITVTRGEASFRTKSIQPHFPARSAWLQSWVPARRFRRNVDHPDP